MSIGALDKHTSRQLTTTQVITSVFSVVKELVENALDAGANCIEINLFEKGLSLVEVKDNGSGITKVDSAYMALASHTSKIKKFDDLESLEYYGFRGEALNALCRVSEVKIITRTQEEDAARCYIMNNSGNIQKAEFCCRTIGTTVQVHSLFKNIPVRRQIINDPKRANLDVKTIENLLKDFGICRPEIRITYRVENIVIFRKTPGETVKESLSNIFGKKMVSLYEFVNSELPECRIDLIIPAKDIVDLATVCHMSYQHIFVNNRPVALKEYEKVIVRVLSEHFEGKFSGRKKPTFFLMISVSPSDVDVNLEPNKTAVLLKNNSAILQAVEKTLVDYYGVEILAENSQQLLQQSLDISSPAYQDFSSCGVENNPEPSTKKRKIDKESRKSTVERKSSDMSEGDKENISKNILKPSVTENVSKSPDPNVRENIISKEGVDSPNSRIKVDPSEYIDFPLLEGERLSQLPEVDLGEDFSTEEIARMLYDQPNQIQTVTDAMENLNPSKEPEFNEKPKSPEKIQMTESQWSKGQHPLQILGGTDIETFGPSELSPNVVQKNPEPRSRPKKTIQEIVEIEKTIQENVEIEKTIQENVEIEKTIQENDVIEKTHNLTRDQEIPKESTPQTYASANSRGFFMFSKEYRPLLLKMNPGMNLVEIAKQITSKWKEMTSEERQNFRALGMKNKSLSESRMLSPSTAHQSKIAHTTPKKTETNKKRLMDLIGNMEAKKKTDAGSKEGKQEARKIVDWTVNINDVSTRINNKSHRNHFGAVVGPISADIWMAKTNAQIWALNIPQLFDSLDLDEAERLKNQGDPNFIEFCLNRCLREKDGLDFMHPIYDMV